MIPDFFPIKYAFEYKVDDYVPYLVQNMMLISFFKLKKSERLSSEDALATAEGIEKVYSEKMRKWMKLKMKNKMDMYKRKAEISVQETKRRVGQGVNCLFCYLNHVCMCNDKGSSYDGEVSGQARWPSPK